MKKLQDTAYNYGAKAGTDENPQKLALEWLNKILARVREVEAENIRLLEIIARKPTGTKAQREAQMLKRTEAAEAECAKLRAALEKIMGLDLDEACAIANEALSKKAGQ